MSEPRNFAFVDLETTGTDEDRDFILEVGVVITDLDLNELDRDSWTVSHPRESGWAQRLDANPHVHRMHTDNGLLEDVKKDGRPVDQVEGGLAGLLGYYADGGRVALAGSGVGHFDSRFIRRHLPNVARLLTYWTIDVGVIRRTLHYCNAGHLVPDAPEKSHRALDDALHHLREARHYFDVLGAPERVIEVEGDTPPDEQEGHVGHLPRRGG